MEFSSFLSINQRDLPETKIRINCLDVMRQVHGSRVHGSRLKKDEERKATNREPGTVNPEPEYFRLDFTFPNLLRPYFS